ncbi:ROK family protein [Nonomuraea sp. KC401]|uniref:ROK family protein n=1 Tax=unclassified Nonomuraea TaxID=2593643 RepID=UPI0010FDA5FC|nr:ROK family protein [Nonomuraea sp. KC401]NBE93616.1 ROK family protein [Nonomuraea sp. K271]TLF85238.1 ROK family protein [Nonomuraea sp. KC401]
MILAVDVGGTKMAAGLVARDGTVVEARRTATPQHADADALWETLTDLIEPLSGRAEGVGVGCGGPMRWPQGEVSPLNIPAWRGFPLRARLAARFPDLPVRLHNDAICLAVAEHWKGAGRGVADMLGMVVSTGVGGGLILNGRLVNGRTGNAGHIGHVVVEPVGGPRCGCGGHGCLEAVARGPALTEWALSQGWTPGAATTPGPPQGAHATAAPEDGPGRAPAPRPAADVPRGGEVPRPGEGRTEGAVAWDVQAAYREDRAVTGRALAADALAGDPVALRAMSRAGRAIGIAIASATHLCDLDLVTIGGGLSQAGELLFGPLEEALREHARVEFARRVKVVPAALGQEAGLVGAAALILATDSYWST